MKSSYIETIIDIPPTLNIVNLFQKQYNQNSSAPKKIKNRL